MEENLNEGLNLQCSNEPQQILPEELFYKPLDFFEESPFDCEKFGKNQSFLIQKVKEAIATMEEELEEAERDAVEFLSSTFQLETWKKLIEQLEESLKSIGNLDKLSNKILQCAVTFYRELLDPIRSIEQFDYLLHLCPNEPEHWGSYGLCLIEMSEQCILSPFNMEKRSALCFIRAARLSIAHILANDPWLKKIGLDEALKLAKEYYYNASDAYPNPVARKGIFLVKMFNDQIPPIDSLQEKKIIFEEEDLTRECQEILALMKKLA